VPQDYLGQALELLENKSPEIRHLSRDKKLLVCEIPFREIMDNFYDKLKNATAGYASMNYEIIGYYPGDLIKMDILIAGEKKRHSLELFIKKMTYQEARGLLKN